MMNTYMKNLKTQTSVTNTLQNGSKEMDMKYHHLFAKKSFQDMFQRMNMGFIYRNAYWRLLNFKLLKIISNIVKNMSLQKLFESKDF